MKSNCVMYVLTAMLSVILVSGSSQSDSCDWIGSGSTKLAQGVRPVYLRCSQGTIRWIYPQGGLRIVLRNGMSSKDFKACFKMVPGSSGARLFLAGKKKLHPIFRNASATGGGVVCVRSSEDHLALFVEADPLVDPLNKRAATFKYHLEKLQKTERTEDECRPCDHSELLQRYCTSDFVLRGTVSSLYHNAELNRSELTVRVVKTYQDSSPSVFQGVQTSDKNVDSSKYVVLHRSLSCGTKPGSGEYLFLGSWTLGNPTLTCIPRLAEWKKVRRKALVDGASLCQMDL